MLRLAEGPMKELVEAIAKALVDNPEQVQVNAVEGEQVTVLELRVHCGWRRDSAASGPRIRASRCSRRYCKADQTIR